jgi:hypothetical protein
VYHSDPVYHVLGFWEMVQLKKSRKSAQHFRHPPAFDPNMIHWVTGNSHSFVIISAIYKMNLVSFGPSNRADKKYQIIFSNPNKTIHFGSKNSETYLDHEDKIKRSNYIARHSVRENWQEVNAGSLSRFLLWGETTDLKTNLNAYLKRFNIKK